MAPNTLCLLSSQGRRHECDEELAAVGVGVRLCMDSSRASRAAVWGETRLRRCSPGRLCLTKGIAALDHELVDYPVKKCRRNTAS
jgi:hypothetical protein